MQQLCRSRDLMVLSVGDSFRIVGPYETWWPGKAGGWQPRAWSSHPDDFASSLIRSDMIWINFSESFEILELYDTERFLSAKVNIGPQYAWINVARKKASQTIWWVKKVDEVR